MQTLPYTVKTASGRQIRFEFPLHALTESEAGVADVLTHVLGAIDRSISSGAQYSDGDVLQGLATYFGYLLEDVFNSPTKQICVHQIRGWSE